MLHFTIANHDWGFVAIGDEAILNVQTKSKNAATAGMAGGLVGGLIAAGIEAAEKRKAEKNAGPPAAIGELAELKMATSCQVRDLPASVRTSPEWPLSAQDHHPVLVIPRRAIQEVRVSFWRGLLVKSRGKTYPFGTNPWHRGKLRQHLAQANYRLA